MGLGVGLVGSCDFVVAASNARFALPEVDRGALGCASHLAKLVPPMRLRQMTYLCRPVTAAELHSWGTIAELVEPEDLVATAREYAKAIAEKRSNVVRAAKMALNGIDTFELADNYRFEQGFTYELNLSDVSDEARQAFIDKGDSRPRG
jgi:enoyl-CoA hydratase